LLCRWNAFDGKKGMLKSLTIPRRFFSAFAYVAKSQGRASFSRCVTSASRIVASASPAPRS